MTTSHDTPDPQDGEDALARLIKGALRLHQRLQRPARAARARLRHTGFGELFVIRVAGNVIGPAVTGSIQYAAVHLQTPLFVVMP